MLSRNPCKTAIEANVQSRKPSIIVPPLCAALTITRTAGAYVIFQEVAIVLIGDDTLLLNFDNS